MPNHRHSLHRPGAGPVAPLYRQIERDLAARIRQGVLPLGSLVPSERQLCERYGVSPITARRALLELARQGLIYRQHGLGTFVADPARGKRLTLVFAVFDEARWRNSAGDMGQEIGGVGEVAWRHSCALHIVPMDRPLDVDLLSRLVREGNTDALLLRLAGNVRAEHIEVLEAEAFPYVFIRRYLPGRPANCVVPADDVGVRLAVAHLARLGHRRIGLINALPDMVLTRDRVRGYLAAVAACGLEKDEHLIRLADSYGVEPGYRLATQLLSRPRPPSALIVDSGMAPGVYQAAAELGMAIPDDLAVVGYDEAPEARALVPRLTFVRTSHYEIGRVAAEVVLDMILGQQSGLRQVFTEPVLDVQASCGARRDDIAGDYPAQSAMPRTNRKKEVMHRGG